MNLRWFLFLCFCFSCFAVSAQDAKTYKKLGDQYYANEKYREALDALLHYHEVKPTDVSVKQKIGICYYFTNNITEAQRFLTYVAENEKNPEPDVYFFLGRSYQAKHQFKEAIKHYKNFLRKIDAENINRPLVKDAIKRSAYGMRILTNQTNVIVENMGDKVNSIGDDFRPILSPNYEGKLYFSSVRAGNLGGLRTDEGFENNDTGKYSSDMYSTSVINGEWTATQPMSYLLNSPKHDVILDFSQHGNQMYFYKGLTQFSGDILVDTFKTIEERSLHATEFEADIRPWEGDCSPHFFNDTILIFASQRKGGYGGFDLYISEKNNGIWQKAINLGPNINSAYDENTPFLAKDGRTLYFSSNRSDRSMGGYDILKSFFVDRTETWTEPVNMKTPINSSGDDKDFRLSKDGHKAFFSSSRKEGLGKNDLYAAYFTDFLSETRKASNPTVFYDVIRKRELKEQAQAAIINNGAGSGNSTDIVIPIENLDVYNFEPLYFDKKGNILSGQNIKKINKLAELAAKYPQLKFIFTANSDGSDPVEFDLYFSIKKAEQISDYLIQQNVKAENIILKGLGSAFPVAKNEINGNINTIGQRLNRRIDVAIENTADLPLQINIKEPEVSKQMKTISGSFMKNASNGLSYKVQIASIKQMYKGDLIFKYPNVMVERSADINYYRYTVGMYKTFNSAQQLKEDLVKQGVLDAYVVPYVNGLRMTEQETFLSLEAYPDLVNFLENR